MSETTKRMKVNKKLAEHQCGGCGEQLAFGEDAVVCTPCRKAYHASCWDDAGGCRDKDCENAALTQIHEPAPKPKKDVPLGRKECPHCGKRIRSSANRCIYCKRVPTPDGVYRGRTSPAPGSTAALVYGILAIFICGVIFGILAINKAGEAQKLIDGDPRYTGAGMATAGKVLGIIALVLWGLGLFIQFSGVAG